jgi:hypothetical protein
MIRVDPGLGSNRAVGRDQEDDVLAPQTPALEVACQSEHEGYARVVDLVVHVLPCANEDNGFGRIGAGALEDGVYVFICERVVRDGVVVLLGCDFEVLLEEDV